MEGQKKSKFAIGLAIIWLIITIIFLTPFGQTYQAAVGVLFGIIPNSPFKPLDFYKPQPILEEVFFPGLGGETMSGDFYRPDNKVHGAVLLIHGVAGKGKKDERLVVVANALARVGITVFVPDFVNIKNGHMLATDREEAVLAFQYLLKDSKIRKDRLGLMGFSYSAGVALSAATDPRIKDYVKFVGSFGGFYDGKSVLKYITTGQFEYQNKIYRQNVDEYSRHVFSWNLVQYLENENDKKILTGLLNKIEKDLALAKEEREKISQLTAEGQNSYNLLTNRDPEKFEALYQKLTDKIHHTIEAVSPKNFLSAVLAKIFIAHGSSDRQIPFTESKKIYDAISDKGKVHLALLGTFTHVDITFPEVTFDTIFNFYIPEFIKFSGFIYDFLWQIK